MSVNKNQHLNQFSVKFEMVTLHAIFSCLTSLGLYFFNWNYPPWNSVLTSLHLCNTGYDAVAVVCNGNDFHVVRATTEQRGQRAVGLTGVARELVVFWADSGVEVLSSKCLVPGQESDSSLAGVGVAHVGRSAGCWRRWKSG